MLLTLIDAHLVLVVDEGEAPATPRVAVQDHLALLDAAEGAELFLQLPLGGVEAQAEHSETLVGLGRLSVLSPSSVSSAAGRRIIGALKM